MSKTQIPISEETALNKIRIICKNNGFDNPENFTSNTRIDNHLDSLDRVELCIGIENLKPKSEISDSEMEEWVTFGDAAQSVMKLLNQ